LIFEPLEPQTAIIRGALCRGRRYSRMAPAFSLMPESLP